MELEHFRRGFLNIIIVSKPRMQHLIPTSYLLGCSKFYVGANYTPQVDEANSKSFVQLILLWFPPNFPSFKNKPDNPGTIDHHSPWNPVASLAFSLSLVSVSSWYLLLELPEGKVNQEFTQSTGRWVNNPYIHIILDMLLGLQLNSKLPSYVWWKQQQQAGMR